MEEVIKYNGEIKQLNQDDIKILVDAGIIPKDTPKAQVELFARNCFEKGLSPFSKQIHLIPRQSNTGTKYTHQTSIDGYRAIADRTGKYAGNDDYIFDDGKTEFEMINSGKKKPTTATATIYKVVGGVRCPFTATARWEEYYPGAKLGFMWDKMPFLMLGKCAESLALRKGFPENLGGVYTNEEMMQADIIIEPEPVKEVKTEKTINEQASEMFKPQNGGLDQGIYDKINLAKTNAELKKVWELIPEKDRPSYQDKFTLRKNIIAANKNKKEEVFDKTNPLNV